MLSDNLLLAVLVSSLPHVLLYIKNSSDIRIANLKFKNHKQQQPYYKSLENILFLLLECSFCKVENVTFIDCGIAAQNLLGKSYLNNIHITYLAKVATKHNVLFSYRILLEYIAQPGAIYEYNNNMEINNLFITGKGNA